MHNIAEFAKRRVSCLISIEDSSERAETAKRKRLCLHKLARAQRVGMLMSTQRPTASGSNDIENYWLIGIPNREITS